MQASKQASSMPMPVPKRFGKMAFLLQIIFVGLFATAIFSYAAYRETSEVKMKATLAKILEITFRQEGMVKMRPAINYLNEVSKHQEELKGLQSLSNLDQAKIEGDMKSMSPEQSQKYLEDQIAGPLYQSQALIDSLKQVDPNAEIDTDNLAFVKLGSSNLNSSLKEGLKWQGIILAGLLLIIILLSPGFKKLSTPGTLVLIGSLPGLLLFSFFDQILSRWIEPYFRDYVSTPVYQDIYNEAITPLILNFRNVYLISALAGLVLIILGLVLGRIFKRN